MRARVRQGAEGLAWLLLVAAVGPAVAFAQIFIGAERCGACHEFAYRVWSQGPHATANESLTGKELGDAKCNTCHTTLPGNQDRRLLGVQCERCHGGGQFYHHSFVTKDKELSRAVGLIDPTPEHCQRCHDDGAPSIEPFEYDAAWSRIDHSAEARRRWEANRGGGGESASP